MTVIVKAVVYTWWARREIVHEMMELLDDDNEDISA
jgi:hypothetical protein